MTLAAPMVLPVLAVGVINLLAATAVTHGVLVVPPLLPEHRPGFGSMRFMLIHDSVHVRSAGPQS